MEAPESQNSRDARIEKLWLQLDPQKKGAIDLDDLQRGLRRIDHPLQNATNILKEVVKSMDKNGDKIIQYEEFRAFVQETEKGLLTVFMDIDRDRNGKVSKEDLQTAFEKSGLSVPTAKLDKFFSDIDENHDGYITFSEWRNFLLFIPTHAEAPLKAVLSYYTSTLKLNSEGDTSINEDTLEGLGTPSNLLNVLFGVIIQLSKSNMSTTTPNSDNTPTNMPTNSPKDSGNAIDKDTSMSKGSKEATLDGNVKSNGAVSEDSHPVEGGKRMKLKLADISLNLGYFAAGAVAGVVSRTATAPLDRLKVYLIANIGSASGTVEAAKKGDAIVAARRLGQPLVDASKELWRAGGIRSLFAGNGLNVVKVMPESAIKFGSYEAAKKFLAKMEGHEDARNISPYSRFVAGGIGGMISQLFVYPLDTLKFRMQCETVEGGLHGNQLIAATARKMIAQGPLKSSYRGLTMGLLGMFPYSAIDLGTFEFLKARLVKHNARVLGCHEDDALPGSFATGCIGAFSGAFGASLVYPINLVRTRLQAQGTVLHPPTYTGAWDVARKTIEKEGYKGLFKGITPNLLKVVPAVSITYMVYENMKKAMKLT